MDTPTSSRWIEFSKESILWRTRGKHWDFEFLHYPHGLDGVSWIRALKEVFSGESPSEIPRTVRGQFSLGGEGRFEFLAAMFLDPDRADHATRRVPHYLALVVPEEEVPATGSFKDLGQDWFLDLLTELSSGDRFDEVFLTGEDRIREWRQAETEPFGKWVRDEVEAVMPEFVRLPAGTNSTQGWQRVETVQLERVHGAEGPSRSVPPAPSGESRSQGVSEVVIEGARKRLAEAVGAFRHASRGPIMGLRGVEKQAEVLARIFNGDTGDGFVRRIAEAPVPGVRLSSKRLKALLQETLELTKLPQGPWGFEHLAQELALDRVLTDLLPEIEEEEALRVVAGVLAHGAKEDDVCVYRIYQRALGLIQEMPVMLDGES